jgi:large subunit ribosomal protein L4
MAKVKLYNKEGKVVGEKDLRDDVFAVPVKLNLIHEVSVSLEASKRNPTAHTKTRGEVSGGGKKPWKQKGTGRARHGSIRSPIWIGGGITFGPRSERDYTVKVNRKTRRQAIRMTLSDKVADEKLLLIDGLGVKNGKTKEFASIMDKLPVSGKVTVVTPETDALLRRSVSNIPDVRIVNVGSIGLMDVLNSDVLLMTPDAADKLGTAYGTDR